jgi:hypothetical protein
MAAVAARNPAFHTCQAIHARIRSRRVHQRGTDYSHEFRAVFLQAASFVETFSGPRVLQLDGYPNASCSK